MNKKAYIMPQIDVVEKEVSRDLLLIVSNTEVDGTDALSPFIEDAELDAYFD